MIPPFNFRGRGFRMQWLGTWVVYNEVGKLDILDIGFQSIGICNKIE